MINQTNRKLVNENKVACVNIVPTITSIYRWENELQIDENESLMIMKTRTATIDELIEFDQMIMEKLEPIYTRLNVDNVTLREKIHFFRSWSTLATPLTADIKDLAQKFDQTKLIINEFENIYNNRMELLENYREQLQS